MWKSSGESGDAEWCTDGSKDSTRKKAVEPSLQTACSISQMVQSPLVFEVI